ncbi:MAG: 30S ribosomal protein S16 [Anaerolineaceae bacterium]|jgi:small subunit ribosomal protein S16
MVRIRLRRTGSAHQPHYRVIIADKESPRDGRFIEIVGHYNPKTTPATIVFDEERVYYWLGVGAQPSDSVQKLFKVVKLDERFARVKAGEEQAAVLEEANKFYEGRKIDFTTANPPAKRKRVKEKA